MSLIHHRFAAVPLPPGEGLGEEILSQKGEMNMAMIKCDKCGALLDPKGIQVRKRTGEEIEAQYFRCRRCGKEYIITVTDGKLRRMLQKIRRDARAIRMVKMTPQEREKRIRKLESRKKNAREYEKTIKEKYMEGILNGKGTADGTEADGQAGVQRGES